MSVGDQTYLACRAPGRFRSTVFVADVSDREQPAAARPGTAHGEQPVASITRLDGHRVLVTFEASEGQRGSLALLDFSSGPPELGRGAAIDEIPTAVVTLA